MGPGILHLSTEGLHSFIVSLSLHRRFALRFILADPLTRSRSPNTEEGRVNDAQWIRLRFHLLRAQLALAIYTLLPVRIMTSTLVAVYFASCSIAKCGHPRMAFFSAASFSALHSSFRYLRSLYIIS